MKTRLFSISFLVWLTALLAVTKPVLAKSYIAYISDSTNSSVIYWMAKEAGIFKKHGLDLGYDLYQRQRSRDSKSDRRRSRLQRRSGNGGDQRQPRRRRHRDHSEPDEYPALLHHRQREHQVARRLEGAGGGGAHPRHLGGFRHDDWH